MVTAAAIAGYLLHERDRPQRTRPPIKDVALTTIAERFAARNRVWINCGVCNHSHELDLARLTERVGADHGTMHDDLTP